MKERKEAGILIDRLNGLRNDNCSIRDRCDKFFRCCDENPDTRGPSAESSAACTGARLIKLIGFS